MRRGPALPQYGPRGDPLVVRAAAAAATSRIRLGPSTLAPPVVVRGIP